MNEPSDGMQVSNNLTPLVRSLFWMKLFIGLGSGALSYFILRFNSYITFYVITPLLYLVTILIAYVYLNNRLKSIKTEMEPKAMVKFALKYTETWIIAFFVLATVMFYFGW